MTQSIRRMKPRTRTPPISDAEEARIQQHIANDPDAPEATDAELSEAKPFAQAFPDLARSIQRARGRPRLAKPRQQVSLRVDPEVLDAFKATGKGWQGRVNDALRKAAAKLPSSRT